MIKLTLTIHEDADVQTIINALERTQTHLTLEVELRPGKPPAPAPFKTKELVQRKFQQALPIVQSAREDWFNTSLSVNEIEKKYNVRGYYFYKYYGNRTKMKRGKVQNVHKINFAQSVAEH